MVPAGRPGKRRYGRWSGLPFGYAENTTACVEAVYVSKQYLSRQCLHKRGYGLDGEFCMQHAKRHPAIKGDKQ